MGTRKTPKGEAAFDSVGGRLRIRFRWQGKRYTLSTGLPDTRTNRRALAGRLAQINQDLAYGTVDPSLDKYRMGSLSEAEGTGTDSVPNLLDLWDKYAAFKLPRLSPATGNDFARYRSYLERCPHSLRDPIGIRDWIASELTPDSGIRLITNLGACCKWAVKSGILSDNPFAGMRSDIRQGKGQSDDEYHIQPFTQEEQQGILNAFEGSRYYACYAPLVRFLLMTGCRHGQPACKRLA